MKWRRGANDHEIGDTVMIRKDLNCKVHPNTTLGMEMYAGRTAKVIYIKNDFIYHLDVDGAQWGWEDHMLCFPFKDEEEAFAALVRGEINKEQYELTRKQIGKS